MIKQYATESLALPEQKKGREAVICRTVGVFFRCAVAFCSAYGTLRFACGSFGLTVDGLYIFLAALVLCTMFSVMAFSKVTAVILGTVMLSGGVMYFSAGGQPLSFLNAVFTALKGAWYQRLCELGYRYEHAIPELSDALEKLGCSEAELYFAGMILAALPICAAAVFFTVRRARLFPMLTLSAVISTVILYFGAGDDLFAFGLMMASLLATASLTYYDSVFVSRGNVMEVLDTDVRSPGAKAELSRTLRENSSRGGYIGAAVLLLSFAVVSLPMQLNRAMPDIPFVSEPALRVERYVSALVNGYAPGGDGFLSIFDNELDGHGTKAKFRKPSGKVLLTVYSDTAVPIYLRTWTGVDYINDRWYTVSYGRRDAYRDLFGDDFSSDSLFLKMRAAIDPALEVPPEKGVVISNKPLGIVTSRVSIEKASPGAEVILPTYVRHDDGIMKFGTAEPHFISYENYHDGVFTGSTFALSDSYSVNADVALTPDSTLAYNISAFVRHYAEQYELIKNVRLMLDEGASEADISAYYESSSSTGSVVMDAYEALENSYKFPDKEATLAYRYVYSMNQGERDAVNSLCDRLASYNDYVYGNYVTLCENHERLPVLMAEIAEANGMRFRSEAATYAGRHRSVTAVIEYLSENMTYTLSPKAPDNEKEYYNAADTFLFDTNEGYCVQYATAAAMMLRSVGVPTRYVEGYLADDFRPSEDAEVAEYMCRVTDFKRHAWIEVYYDYFGWLRYEVTTPYMTAEVPGEESGEQTENTDLIYTESESEVRQETETVEPITPDTDDDSEGRGENGGDRRSAVVISVVSVFAAITASAFAVILALRKRFARFTSNLRELMKTSSRKSVSDSERVDAARRMGDILTKLLAYHSLTPFDGETASQFGCRCDGQLQPLVGISIESAMKAVQAGEFADSISNEELLSLSEYLDRLLKNTLGRASLAESVKLKYFVLVS